MSQVHTCFIMPDVTALGYKRLYLCVSLLGVEGEGAAGEGPQSSNT